MLLVLLFLDACQPGLVTPEEAGGEAIATPQLEDTLLPSPTGQANTPTRLPPLATPQADSPAAGICDFYPGELVVFEIYPDIPSPRCARATPKQHLKVINRTGQEMRFWIGNYEYTLQPGEEQVIDAELRTYLAPGVHRISTTVYFGEGGPELWLTTDP
jgi:hypothetical protein